jgi:hypothetical protein
MGEWIFKQREISNQPADGRGCAIFRLVQRPQNGKQSSEGFCLVLDAGECRVPVYSNTPVSTIFCEITVQKSCASPLVMYR